jgi:hypothetical protein
MPLILISRVGGISILKEDLKMILYQASLTLPVLTKYYEIFLERLNVLISMAIMRGDTKGFLEDYRFMSYKIVADSGAWSVAKGTSKLTLESVISYLQLWGHKFNHYFNFDTDFSDQGFSHNIGNQFKMERAGLQPIPVVHNFFDREIDYYIQSGKYSWLALGSSQSTNFDDFRYAVERIKGGNPQIKIHWFGGSRFDWLINLPIASCDTSSWAKTGAVGCISYWNPHNPSLYKGERIYIGGCVGGEKDGYHFVTYPWKKDVEEYLDKTFGFEYGKDLCGCDDKFNMQLVNTRFFAKLEDRINQERMKRGIPLE